MSYKDHKDYTITLTQHLGLKTLKWDNIFTFQVKICLPTLITKRTEHKYTNNQTPLLSRVHNHSLLPQSSLRPLDIKTNINNTVVQLWLFFLRICSNNLNNVSGENNRDPTPTFFKVAIQQLEMGTRNNNLLMKYWLHLQS